jgi:hypothetical protein
MTTTAKKTKTAKSPKKVKAQVRRITKLATEAGIPTTAAALKDALVASIEATAPKMPGLDDDAGLPAEEIGEVVKPGKAKRAPLSEAECAAAGEAWIEAKDGRLARYGVVEASSGVIDDRCTLTTTNFHLLEVEATTGKVRYLGVSPLRPSKKPVAPAKAKAAKLPTRGQEAPKAKLSLTGVDFTALKGIEPAAAQRYAEMLASGNPVTPRAVETATGLTMRQRGKVDGLLGRAGYSLRFERNPDRDRADRFTANLYYITRD